MTNLVKRIFSGIIYTLVGSLLCTCQSFASVTITSTGGGSGDPTIPTGTDTGLDSSSVFHYSGTAPIEAPATLRSDRTIGGLEIQNGYLNIGQATLGTSGEIEIISGGLLLNGTSTGTLTLSSDQNFTQTGGTIYFTLGTTSDTIQSGGGTSTFSTTGGTLILDTGAGFDYGDSYILFSGFSSGSISNLTISGYDTASYLASLGMDGVLTFTVVPEASTIVMLGLGIVCLMGNFVRNRRKVIA